MQVIIEHPKSGQQYEIALADFSRGKHFPDPKTGELETYESAGFKIVSQADGSPYEPRQPRGEHAP